MPANKSPTSQPRPFDQTDLTDMDSFPASDPPPASPGASCPVYPSRPVDSEHPVPNLVEVKEHPVSDPTVMAE